MTILINGPRIPTPFGGSLKLPDLESPPLALPSMPDAKGMKVIGHALGSDVSQVFGIIPFVGGLLEDMLEDSHEAEIRSILTPLQYNTYEAHNKALPSALAAVRTLAFKK